MDTLRDKVAKIIHPNLDHKASYECCATSRKHADSIIALIRAKVEGIKNPYQGLAFYFKNEGFEQARQEVLKVLGE